MNIFKTIISRKDILQSKILGILLTSAAGFMGVYSYLLCGQIYSNGLTGNLIFISINIHNANFSKAFTYLGVVIAFSLGVFFAYFMRHIFPKNKFINFRQVNILIEIILLIMVIIIPEIHVSHFLITFACGIQIENYEKIRGLNVSTVNFVGNTKIGAHQLCLFLDTKDPKELKKALVIYMLMLTFVIGAFIGTICIDLMKEKSLIICIIILSIGFIYTFFDTNQYSNQEEQK